MCTGPCECASETLTLQSCVQQVLVRGTEMIRLYHLQISHADLHPQVLVADPGWAERKWTTIGTLDAFIKPKAWAEPYGMADDVTLKVSGRAQMQWDLKANIPEGTRSIKARSMLPNCCLCHTDTLHLRALRGT
jgi:hypothetical protein